MNPGLSEQLKLFYELHKKTLSGEIEEKKKQTGLIIVIVFCVISPLALSVLLPLNYFIFKFFEGFWGVNGSMLGVLLFNSALLTLTVYKMLRLLESVSSSKTVAELKKDVDMLMKGTNYE